MVAITHTGQAHSAEALIRDLLDSLRQMHIDPDDENLLRLLLYEAEIWQMDGREEKARGKILRARNREMALQNASLLEVCGELLTPDVVLIHQTVRLRAINVPLRQASEGYSRPLVAAKLAENQAQDT